MVIYQLTTPQVPIPPNTFIGIGKTIVDPLSPAMKLRVCR